VKPIGRSSQGFSINTVVAVALSKGRLQLYDIYGNFIIEWATENQEEIIQIRPNSAPYSDDKFVAVLTD